MKPSMTFDSLYNEMAYLKYEFVYGTYDFSQQKIIWAATFFPFDTFFQPQRYLLNLGPLKFDNPSLHLILGVPAALYLVSEEKGGHCIYKSPQHNP